MLNRGITNIINIVSANLFPQVLADSIVNYLHELLFLDGEAGYNIMRLVKKFGNLVVQTSKVTNYGLFFLEIFGPENIVEETVADNKATFHDIEHLKNFIKLVLDTPITFRILPRF